MREPNYYTFFTENVNDFFAFVQIFFDFLFPHSHKSVPLGKDTTGKSRVYVL